MKKYFCFYLSLLFIISEVNAQVTLDADGPGGTYALITSVLAPNQNPIEVPDCDHTSFGDHIDELWDADLGDNVFRFYLHKEEDSDRCINYDRQRNEIKSYDQSPDNLLGIEGEQVVYKWKFKLDADFQPSPKFTHLHQLKAVGGSESSMPLITLTARFGTPERLELRYAEDFSQITLTQTDLSPFKGTWCEVVETVTYGESGNYSLVINKVSDGLELISYSDNNIRMWKTDADFVRPKWGIYRSLVEEEYLRNEEVLFANFSIEEVTALPVELSTFNGQLIDKDIHLNWQTNSENNNKGFEIQRSNDGRSWEMIDFVKGKGNTDLTSNYHFIDKHDFSGTLYYRLKQIDEDGHFEFSKSIAISKKSLIDIQLFPNPTNGKVEISGLDQHFLLEVYDIAGSKILMSTSNTNKLDLSNLQKGTYLVKISIGQEVVIKKIVR